MTTKTPTCSLSRSRLADLLKSLKLSSAGYAARFACTGMRRSQASVAWSCHMPAPRNSSIHPCYNTHGHHPLWSPGIPPPTRLLFAEFHPCWLQWATPSLGFGAGGSTISPLGCPVKMLYPHLSASEGDYGKGGVAFRRGLSPIFHSRCRFSARRNVYSKYVIVLAGKRGNKMVLTCGQA